MPAVIEFPKNGRRSKPRQVSVMVRETESIARRMWEMSCDAVARYAEGDRSLTAADLRTSLDYLRQSNALGEELLRRVVEGEVT